MANEPHKLLLLPNRTYQASVRSEIKKMANTMGFTSKRLAELEIVVAELTSNMVKHTSSGGELLVKILEGDSTGIEIIGIDAGPGIEQLGRVMEDGISSANTLGHGLGAMKRLADEFDAYSLKGWGTIILCRVFNKKPVITKRKPVETGVVMLAKTGEQECGDNYDYSIKGNTIRFALCDGLGHGPQAAVAARECLRAFKENLLLPPAEQVKMVHTAVKRTRGAVMCIVHIDFNNKQMLYCGVGNLSVKACSVGRSKSCVSYNGIVGHSIPGTLNNHLLSWAKNDLLIMHSDGLSAKWDLQKYPLITRHDRTIIAAALYKDFCRKTDDVMVAVISQYNHES